MKKILIKFLKAFFKDVIFDAVVDYSQDALKENTSLSISDIDKLGDAAIAIAEVSMGHKATDMDDRLLGEFKRSVKSRNVAEFIGKM